MLRINDEEYKQTRLIKKGKLKLDQKFSSFARWINETFAVDIMNIYVDVINGCSTRIQLIFEHRSSLKKFELRDPFKISYYKKKKISKKYCELFAEENPQNIFVLFYAFEPLAKEAANTKIPLKNIELLIAKHAKMLWQIMRYGEHAIFFFYNTDQLAEAKTCGLTDRLKKEYYSILKPLDEFDYFTLTNFNTIYDSKQNFDEKYNSNWRYYFD